MLVYLQDEFIFKMYVVVFQLQQTVAAKAIAVLGINKSPFFGIKTDAITLALGNIAHLALKTLVATRAISGFVNTHIFMLTS
jgi:hypothetical protein